MIACGMALGRDWEYGIRRDVGFERSGDMRRYHLLYFALLCFAKSARCSAHGKKADTLTNKPKI